MFLNFVEPVDDNDNFFLKEKMAVALSGHNALGMFFFALNNNNNNNKKPLSLFYFILFYLFFFYRV